MLSFVSAVFVVEDEPYTVAEVETLSQALATHFSDVEIVIVANAVADDVALWLKKVVAAVPDVTCHFLAQRIDTDAALVVGLDHAIGDYVLLGGISDAERKFLPTLVSAMDEGFELALVEVKNRPVAEGLFYGPLRRTFFKFVNLLTDVDISAHQHPLRLMSRPTALYIVNAHNAELLLKARSPGAGFPAKIIPVSEEELQLAPRRRPSQMVNKALMTIVTTSAAPLRMVSVLGLITSLAALLYSVYVMIVYLFKPDVEAGWTTLSLELTLMLFVFSCMFALLAEYILQIYSHLPLRRRQVVVRDLRSPHSRRADLLNVVDESGGARLGAPAAPTPGAHGSAP